MMFVGLPDGFTMERAGHLIGETWAVGVYYKEIPAFQMVSDFDVADGRPRYAARSVAMNSLTEDFYGWQQFSSLGEMVLVMCTKHRMGVE